MQRKIRCKFKGMRTQSFLKFTKCLKDIHCRYIGCIDVDGAIKTQEECLHNKRHICVWPYLVRIEFLCHLMHHLAMACRSILNHPLVIPLTPAPDEDNLRKPWKRSGGHIKLRVTRKKPYNPENRGAEFTVIIFVIVTAEFSDESNNWVKDLK